MSLSLTHICTMFGGFDVLGSTALLSSGMCVCVVCVVCVHT